MAKKISKQIKSFNAAFGGYQYRVTSNGETVNYQEMSPRASSYRTRASESVDAFNKFADKVGLYDSNSDNPAVIARRIEQLA